MGPSRSHWERMRDLEVIHTYIGAVSAHAQKASAYDAFGMLDALVPTRRGGSAACARVKTALRVTLTYGAALGQPLLASVSHQFGCPGIAVALSAAVRIPRECAPAVVHVPIAMAFNEGGSESVASAHVLLCAFTCNGGCAEH